MSERVDLGYTAGPQMNPQEMLTQSSSFVLSIEKPGGGGRREGVETLPSH